MKISRFILPLALVSLSTPLSAEQLLIDVVKQEPPNNSSGLLRPKAMSTMQQVRADCGEPQKILSARGKPPITRWVYPQYTVYFENNKVIKSVVPRRSKTPAQP
ncbi:MAG: DUF2845 domain-containing protein [gamma proteobacterium symbiont of Bathyaustriella thionipta]|nr:DUF2845 domain-containing protein [gamma proteobacterium symbiont of Bathyaustriella thionipta]